MPNTPLVIAIVALVLAAASFGYTGLMVSQEIGSVKSQLGAVEQSFKSVDSNFGAVKKSLQDTASKQSSLEQEQKAIKTLVEQQIGGLEKALKEARQQVEQARKEAAEREALLKQVTPFDQALVAAALKEGSLTIYSVRDQQDLVVVSQEFQKKFPGIKVSFLTAKNAELLAKISAEMKLPKSTWDIFDSSEISNASELGATQVYRSPQYTKENFFYVDPSEHLTFTGATVPVVIYNTKMVKKSDIDAVKSWEDVPKLAAKYPGKILLHHPSTAGQLSGVLAELKIVWKNDAKWNAFLSELKGLNARMFKSTGEIGRLVISEEGAIGIVGLLHDVIQGKERGAPIGFIPLSLIPITPTGVTISKNAPHPNAAKLFVEFMLSPDGQEVFSRAYRSPTRIGFVSKSSLDILFPKVDPSMILAGRNTEYRASPIEFTKKNYEPIFGPA